MDCDTLKLLMEEHDRLYEERYEFQEEARKLQAEEYKRRLEALNHEASQLKSMQSTYVPRETYDRDLAERDKRIAELISFKDNLTGRIAVLAIVYSAVMAVIFFLADKALG